MMKKVFRFFLASGAIITGIGFFAFPAKAYYPTEAINNGGFESDPVGTGWSIIPTNSGTIGTFPGTTWHGGTRGIHLGEGPMDPIQNTTNSLQYVYQNPSFTIPSNASSVSFSFWYSITTDEVVAGRDTIYFTVITNSDSEPHCAFYVDAAQATQNTWLNRTCDLTAVKGQAVHIYTSLTVDNAGTTIVNIDDFSVVSNFLDLTAPTTNYSTVSVNPSTCTFTKQPIITLSASDDVGGSGVASILYHWDSGSFATYTGTLAAPAGIHTLYYYSVDAAGNSENAHSQVVQYGDTRPLAERLADLNKGITYDAALTKQLLGRILLQIQKNGEAWYLYPKDSRRYFLCRPRSSFQVMRKLGLGISNADLSKIPRYGTNDVGDAALVARLKGQILLQVQKNGEAWYLNPVNGKRYYMGRPSDAFSLMKNLGLGITNTNLNKILIGLVE